MQPNEKPAPTELNWQFIRTDLANERTFLAWSRTTLSLFSIGFPILKVEHVNTPNVLTWYDSGLGLIFCSTSLGCMIAGVYYVM